MSEDQANVSVGEEDLPGSGDTHNGTAQDKLNAVTKILKKQLEGLESLQTWCEQQAHRMIIAVGQLALVEQLLLHKGVPENMRTNGGVLLAYVYSQTAKELPGLVPGNNVSQKIIRPPNVSHLRDLIDAKLDFQDEDDVFDGIRSALYFAAANIIYACDGSVENKDIIFATLSDDSIRKYINDAEIMSCMYLNMDEDGPNSNEFDDQMELNEAAEESVPEEKQEADITDDEDIEDMPELIDLEEIEALVDETSKSECNTGESYETKSEEIEKSNKKADVTEEEQTCTEEDRSMETGTEESNQEDRDESDDTDLYVINEDSFMQGIVDKIWLICNPYFQKIYEFFHNCIELSLLLIQICWYEITGKLLWPNRGKIQDSNKYKKPTLGRIANMLNDVEGLCPKYHIKEDHRLIVSTDKHPSPAVFIHNLAASTFDGVMETVAFYKFILNDHLKIIDTLLERDEEAPVDAAEKFSSLYPSEEQSQRELHHALLKAANKACREVTQTYGKKCSCDSLLHIRLCDY